MARKGLPSHRRQKGGKQDRAFVVLNGVRHYLGVYDTPESWDACRKLTAEWKANGCRPEVPKNVVSVVVVFSRRGGQRDGQLDDRRADALAPGLAGVIVIALTDLGCELAPSLVIAPCDIGVDPSTNGAAAVVEFEGLERHPERMNMSTSRLPAVGS